MTEKKEHPNAMLLRWIADGEIIQYSAGDIWYDAVNEKLLRNIANGGAYDMSTYRVRPKTIRIGKYDVAEPMKEKPDDNCVYFYIDAAGDRGVESTTWTNHEADSNAFESGMCWINPEDAELAAKAIKKLLTGQ